MEGITLFMSSCISFFFYLIIFFKRFHLFLEKGREREREGEKHQCVRYTWSVASHMPTWDLTLRPSHVLWPGIKSATFWFAGWRSVQAVFMQAVFISRCSISAFTFLCVMFLLFKFDHQGPDRRGSVGWMSSSKVKGHRLDSLLRARSPAGGVQLIDVPLQLFLLPIFSL